MQRTVTRDFAPGLDRAFICDRQERSCVIERMDGPIPSYLNGTIYLNGPARFQFPCGFRYQNWLDGDGMVSALRLNKAGATFKSRFVRGRKFLREQASGKPVYRTFGTAFSGDRLRRGIGTESPFNVSVFPYRGKLLAFGEQSLPMELDPSSLETLTPGQTFDFCGALNDAAPFSAHPKIDARTGELLNFGLFYSPNNPLLMYYRFDASCELVCRSRISIEYPYAMHDFAVSENYVVFYASPHLLDSSRLTEQGLTMMDSLSWQPWLGSQLLVLCRSTGREVARIRIDARFCLHTINAFELDGQLALDVIEFDRPIYDQYQPLPDLFVEAPVGQLVRYTIDLTTLRVASIRTIESHRTCDFPVINPSNDMRCYEDLWMLGISHAGVWGRKYFDQLIHARWSNPDELEIWDAPTGQYLGSEPVYVADPDNRHQGMVVLHIYDAQTDKSRYAFFNAYDIAAGPVASVSMEFPTFLGFHASFQAENAHQSTHHRDVEYC